MSFGDEVETTVVCGRCRRRRLFQTKTCACGGFEPAAELTEKASAELEAKSMRDTLDLANRLLWKLGRKVNHR